MCQDCNPEDRPEIPETITYLKDWLGEPGDTIIIKKAPTE
jgi:hypothetical protein